MADLNIIWKIILIAAIVLGGCGTMFGALRRRVVKVEDEKVDVKMCKTLHNQVTNDLNEIKGEIKEFRQDNVEHGNTLTEIKTILNRMNGGKT